MPGHVDWQPYRTHVQGGLREGNFLNGQFVLICAGPPHLQDVGAAAIDDPLASTKDVAFPIGLTQNIAITQNKAISRIFEIGSDRSYFITGRTVGQLSLSRIMYHGPSLLRLMYAYYTTGPQQGTYPIDPLYPSEGVNPINYPYGTGPNAQVNMPEAPSSLVKLKDGLHGVRFPPGFDNFWINLASDIFSQPVGLLLIFRDNEENDVAAVYLEQCYVPTSTIAMDSQGLIIQESIGIQYERIVPIANTAVKLVSEILPDWQGTFAF